MRSTELSIIYAWHSSKDCIYILSSRPHKSSLGWVHKYCISISHGGKLRLEEVYNHTKT